MEASWSRKAVSHSDPSLFENDKLLKSLGNQLNVNFSNYDQWQRKELSDVRPVTVKKKDAQMTFKVGTIERTTSAKSSPIKPIPRATSAKSTASKPISRCQRIQAKHEEDMRIQQEKCEMLELKIRQASQAIRLYEQKGEELVEMNLAIAKEIENQEHEVYAEVKRLLRKYEKFRGGIATLNTNFMKELAEVKSELDETKTNVQLKLQGLQQQDQEMDTKLKLKQAELSVLKSYKDKEYPVKTMIIANLHTELENVKNSNQEDQEELENIITTELGKYDKERIQITNKITHRATEESLAKMHPSLHDMALQNMIMRKEIEFHKKSQEELTQKNKELEEEVARLMRHPKSNIRLQMFPEFFLTREKCTPDMDVVLDIPKQEWLPL